jgi:hypothetical protein
MIERSTDDPKWPRDRYYDNLQEYCKAENWVPKECEDVPIETPIPNMPGLPDEKVDDIVNPPKPIRPGGGRRGGRPR